jgi:thiol:disulfide interchange protein DsbD
MKKIGLLILSLVYVLLSHAQGKTSNATWSFSVNKLSDCEAELVFTVKVDEGWHVYSQLYDANPTTFNFKKTGNYKLVGKVAEPTPFKEVDADLGMTLYYFKPTTVSFKQKIELNANQPFKVTGDLVAQVCTDQGICEISRTDFSFSVDPAGIKCLKDPNDLDGDGTGNAEDKCPDIPGLKELMGCPDGDADGITDAEDKCPEDKGTLETGGCPVETTVAGGPGEGPIDLSGCGHVEPEKISDESLARFNDDCGTCAGGKKAQSYWAIFIAGFIGGLLALLMPCIFPMIPMTVSFFTKQSKTRAKGIVNAGIYAASIVVIYTTLGLLVTVIAGPTALNNMSTSTFWNILFFVIFIIFAASFLGAFEITLPSKLVNAVDKGSNRGGLIGIFFMAFTLSLVSFSCTGPIIGSLLVEAAKGTSYLGPAIGMFGFSLALAIPFALFAAFPGWLQSLPKSGGWLNSVKVVLGFAEIALAFKFLSTVDLVQHLGFLKREIYIAIWITCSLLIALYLIGAFNLKHDSDGKPKLSVPRVSFAVLFFILTAYMVPGLFGAPLNLLSGYIPPSYYKEWKDPNDKFADCPNGMECYHDYDEGMCIAQKRNKPVMLDFTGYGCVNCRKMEDNVWIDPKIYKILSQDLVLISLYVDDYDHRLPMDQRVPSLSDPNVKLKSYGDKWGDFQRYYFGKNSQPQYILLTPDGKLLNCDQAYTDKTTYLKWLEAGMCRWKVIKDGKTPSGQ